LRVTMVYEASKEKSSAGLPPPGGRGAGRAPSTRRQYPRRAHAAGGCTPPTFVSWSAIPFRCAAVVEACSPSLPQMRSDSQLVEEDAHHRVPLEVRDAS
jgi:hypothetical protein